MNSSCVPKLPSATGYVPPSACLASMKSFKTTKYQRMWTKTPPTLFGWLLRSCLSAYFHRFIIKTMIHIPYAGTVVLKPRTKSKEEVSMESLLPLGKPREICSEHLYAQLPAQKPKPPPSWVSGEFQKSALEDLTCSAFRLGIEIWSSTRPCFCPSTVLLFSEVMMLFEKALNSLHEFAKKIGRLSDGTTWSLDGDHHHHWRIHPAGTNTW